jgi:hypothetical protein
VSESTDVKSESGLQLLRKHFEPHQISQLPKPLKKEADKGYCQECHTYHGLPAIHLDYVGHAATTDRLLNADLHWTWEAMSYGPDGLPALDKSGGLWIWLTVCGVRRPGYGSVEGKTGGNAVKELIGDAIRNAAMRFGVALDLWHKGILHKIDIDQHDDGQEPQEPPPTPAAQQKKKIAGERFDAALASVRTGDYTAEKIRKHFDLTEDQETMLSDLQRELGQ